jgi:hypothetical protein
MLSRTLLGKAGIPLPTDGMRLRRGERPHLSEMFRSSASLHLEGPSQDTTVKRKLPMAQDLPDIQLRHEHKAYRLGIDEMGMCEEVLQERRIKWILPVPAGSTDSDKAIRHRLKGANIIHLRGVDYYVLEERHGFAQASKAARVGDVLHIWFEPKVDESAFEKPDITVKVRFKKEQPPGSKPGKKDGVRGIVWDKPYVTCVLDETEESVLSGIMKERELLWMAPVPSEDKRNPGELGTKYGWGRIFDINKKTYYVFEGEKGDHNARRVVKIENVLHVWYDDATDYEILGETRKLLTIKRSLPVDLENGAITMLSDRCSLVLRGKDPKRRLIVLHGSSHCEETINIDEKLPPGESKVLVSDRGERIVLAWDAEGGIVAEIDEGQSYPRTKELKDYSDTSNAWTGHGHEEEAWEIDMKGGYRLSLIKIINNFPDKNFVEIGSATYVITNPEIPGYARVFSLEFGETKREEKKLQLGHEIILTVAADGIGSWIAVAEMNPHKRY